MNQDEIWNKYRMMKDWKGKKEGGKDGRRKDGRKKEGG